MKATREPFVAIVAAVVAMTALFVTMRSFLSLVAAVGMLCVWLAPWRLERTAGPIRAGRTVFYALALWTAYLRFTDPVDQINFEALLALIFGQLCAVEIMLQAALKSPASGPRSPAIVLLATIVLASSSYTYGSDIQRHGNLVPALAPLYFLFLGLALRSYASPSQNRILFWKHGLLLAGVLGFSASMNMVVAQFRSELSSFSLKFFELKGEQATGLDTAPQLGASYNLKPPFTRMLRIENPSDGVLYLRAAAFSDYENGSWLPAVESRRSEQVASEYFLPPAGAPLMRVERLAEKQPFLYAPIEATGVRQDGSLTLEWKSPLGPLSDASEGGPPPVYELSVAGDTRLAHTFNATPDAAWRERYLFVPSTIDPRVRELAEQVGRDAKSDEQKIRNVTAHLAAHHSYSLTSRFLPGDKVSQFLLKKKSAHCEFFASSAVVLLRCLGVPARFVIGYMAHEPDGPDALVVRAGDAHAWAEAYVGGRWVTVEATPASGQPSGLRASLPWTERFRDFFDRAKRQAKSALAALQARPRLLAALGICVGLLFLLRAFSGRRTKPAKEFSYTSANAGLAKLARRFDKLLTRRKIPCPQSVSWSEHLARSGWHAAQPFAAAYEAARFGPDSASVDQLQRLLNELERDVKSTPQQTSHE